MYMASRFNVEATPFDKFLLEPFLANKLENFSSKTAWLEQCKNDLSAKTSRLRGLGSAILIRHIMGESADLGLDNMLIVVHADVQHKAIISVLTHKISADDIHKESKFNS